MFDIAGGSRLTPEELDVFTGLRTSLQDAASPPSNAGFYWTFMAGLAVLSLMASVNVEMIVIGLGMLLMLSSTIGLLLTQVHRAVTSNGIPRFLHSPYTWASVMLLSYLYRWEEVGRSSGSLHRSGMDLPSFAKGWFNLQHRPTG